LIELAGNRLSSRSRRNTLPTAPVAPTTAILQSFNSFSLQPQDLLQAHCEAFGFYHFFNGHDDARHE